MKLKPLTLAVLIATAQLSGTAFAQASKTPASPSVQTASPSAKAPLTIKPTTDWIIYDDQTYTPVADEVSLHLEAARKAFVTNDKKKAAAEFRAVADELKKQAARAGHADTARDKSRTKLARDAAKRLNAAATKVASAAAGIESGKILTNAQLDKAIDKAARADMEHRWLVTDVATWYPVSEEPQRHFGAATEAYAKKEYKAAAAEIRKGTSYLRLEAGRASGEAKKALDSSVAELDKLAAAVEKGTVKGQQSLDREFAKADRALALEHRAEAAESWARKEYDQAGYELKAAGHALDSAAAWAGAKAKAGASSISADTRTLGDKLVSGATWTRDEVAQGFTSLGHGIAALGREIGINK